jgi:hypothetical protein
MVQFRMEDPEVMLFHNEAIVRDGRIVGPVTSGNYGHFLGGAIGMGYVPCAGESEEEVLASATRSRWRGCGIGRWRRWCRCMTRNRSGCVPEALRGGQTPGGCLPPGPPEDIFERMKQGAGHG